MIILSCINKDAAGAGDDTIQSEISDKNSKVYNHLTTDHYVRDIVNHSAFMYTKEL